jgi:hypothetical protein
MSGITFKAGECFTLDAAALDLEPVRVPLDLPAGARVAVDLTRGDGRRGEWYGTVTGERGTWRAVELDRAPGRPLEVRAVEGAGVRRLEVTP